MQFGIIIQGFYVAGDGSKLFRGFYSAMFFFYRARKYCFCGDESCFTPLKVHWRIGFPKGLIFDNDTP